MKAAYVTIHDPFDVRTWSGLHRHIALALERQAVDLEYVGPLRNPYRPVTEARRLAQATLGRKRYLPDRFLPSARSYARQVARRLRSVSPDIVFGVGTIPLAFLETDRPVAFWADATFAGMVDFYRGFTGLDRASLANGDTLERAALERAALALYASDWAAASAIEAYGADPRKVEVVPFGPNLDGLPSRSEVERLVSERPLDRCVLLFLGVDWERKGGDVALEAARILNEGGLPAELVVAGCEPPLANPPPFLVSRGFVSKESEDGRAELRRLLAAAHFLVHPARAEAFGVAVAEASAFGVPALASAVGGLTTAVADGRNGRTLPPQADGAAYAALVRELLGDPDRYRALALSSFDDSARRLSWTVAGAEVCRHLERLL